MCATGIFYRLLPDVSGGLPVPMPLIRSSNPSPRLAPAPPRTSGQALPKAHISSCARAVSLLPPRSAVSPSLRDAPGQVASEEGGLVEWAAPIL